MASLDASLGLDKSSTIISDDHRFYDIFQNSLTSLCFDRSEFNRPDFNVDAFLTKARRRGASLEQIRDDARVYLKIIQNSMIELINKDYADFVHLSSNLAGLRGAIEKLETESDEMSSEFELTATKIRGAVQELTKETEEKRRLASEQRLLAMRITGLTILESLKKFLVSTHFTSSNENGSAVKDFECICRVSYMIEELQAIRNSCSTSVSQIHPKFDQCFSSVLDFFQNWLETKLIDGVENSNSLLLVYILRGFSACDRLDAARAIFIANFIDPDLRQCFSDQKKKQKLSKINEFKNVLDQVLILRSRYEPVFHQNSTLLEPVLLISEFPIGLDENSWKLSASFLDDCLLTALLSYQQDRFASILIPTDAAVFRKAFRLLVSFAEHWSRLNASNKILKMIFDKFSLLIYYELCYHELTSAIDSDLVGSLDEILQPPKREHFALKSTSVIYQKLTSIWSVSEEDQLVIPPLFPKFWELTCMVINRYGKYAVDCVTDFQKWTGSKEGEIGRISNGEKNVIPKVSSPAVITAPSQSPDPSMLILYYSDFRKLERRICGDLLSKIFDHCSLENSDFQKSIENCLSNSFTKFIGEIKEAIVSNLVPWLSGQIANQLGSVIEVPRQYRWTRKEAPTQPSPYLSSALDPIRQLSEISSREMPSDSLLISSILDKVISNIVNGYTENLKSVVDSVEKISSSLNRLKTKGATSGTGGGGGRIENMNAVTDEQKIRLQLRLDVEDFERILNSFQLPTQCDLNEMKILVNSSNIPVQET